VVALLDHDPAARAPGQYTRSIVQRLRIRTLLTLGAVAAVTTVAGRRFGWQDPRFLGAEVALLLVILAVFRWVLPLVERHDRGATGEEEVGELLAELTDDGWHVVHDATLGRGNVDHVLVGPGGVYTVETKSHAGPVHVARLHGAVLRQAQAQRRAVELAVGEHVEPLVVYSRAWVDRPLSRRRGVRVVPARMVLGYVSRQSPRLSPAEVERVHARLVEALAADASQRRWPIRSRATS
jgi:hypothetical protein